MLGGLKQAAAGILIRMTGAVWLTRLMERLLFGVTPRDPVTLGCVAALLLVTALLACYVPARRATK